MPCCSMFTAHCMSVEMDLQDTEARMGSERRVTGPGTALKLLSVKLWSMIRSAGEHQARDHVFLGKTTLNALPAFAIAARLPESELTWLFVTSLAAAAPYSASLSAMRASSEAVKLAHGATHPSIQLKPHPNAMLGCSSPHSPRFGRLRRDSILRLSAHGATSSDIYITAPPSSSCPCLLALHCD